MGKSSLMVVIIVLCLVALIAGSVFGIFFSGEDSGTGMSMQTVVQEINQEYDDRLEPVSYTHLDVYKRQILCSATHHLSFLTQRAKY